MSIYVTSDLHGYSLDKIKNRLDEIGFCLSDRLYILGDCIDRGTDGLKIVRWCMSQLNVILLLGNHEAMLLDNSFLFDGDTIPSVLDLKGTKRNSYCIWTSNGGYSTIDSIQQYSDAQIKYIISYLEKAPLYAEVIVNDKTYILTHSGLGAFSPDKPLSEYSRSDLVWNRPSLNTEYYNDGRVVIFGHTPTVLFGPEHKGKIISTNTWIDIDVGAGLGLIPLILRLDDMKQYYI